MPGTYTFTLTAVDMTEHVSRDVTLGVYVGVSEAQETALPMKFSLSQGSPSPFDAFTTVSYSLAEDCQVDVSIYDARGRLVRKVVRDRLPRGAYRVEWDGRDSALNPLPSGVYFCVLRTSGTRVFASKLVLLR